jgi:activator of 2-hydroxyglutaryl-CoA dehydratase
VCALIEEHLGVPVIVPEEPDIVGALGAALHGERGLWPVLAETAAAS